MENATAVGFRIRGNGKPLMLTFINPDVVTDFNSPSFKMDATPTEWTQMTVDLFNDLESIWSGDVAKGWDDIRGGIHGFYFETFSQVVGEEGEVWIDDVRIIE
jgi:hypothetical protein